MPRAVRAGLVFAVLVGLLVALLEKLVDRFIYYPMRYPEGEWELQGESGAQDQWLTAEDGTTLHAWWFPKAGASFASLFLHGNAGNVTHRIDHAHAVLKAGSAFFVLDYRGYGKSKGHPSEHGLYEDADAAYARLLQLGYAPDRIIVQGESLGTAVAVDLAARRQCAGMILESPLMSAARVAGTVLPFVGPLFVHGFDTYDKISRVHVPVMVIHGEADEIVPFSQGRNVFLAAHEPKQFWAVPGAHHNDLLETAGPQYVTRLRAFYCSISQRK